MFIYIPAHQSQRNLLFPLSFVRPAHQGAEPTHIDETGYDSDDYERNQGFTVSSAPGAKSTAARPHEALGHGFNLLLLFGAAVDRYVSSIERAIIGTGQGIAKLAARSPPGRKMQRWKRGLDDLAKELPDDTWGKLLWLWDRPQVQRIRLTISMANLSIRLPALLALVATQVGLLASQVSLPMLAPLLLGTGMLMRSIRTNASMLFPRLGLLVVLLWLVWFVNSVIQNTVAYLRRQNALDQRMAGGIITLSEIGALVTAGVVLLSMLGVNVSALLLPAGIAVAVAAKDLTQNFLAGFFLFMVQPFKLGDRVAVTMTSGSSSHFLSSSSPAANGPWFEGVCEKVDLRYTVLRQGKRRLVVPNASFLMREFMICEESSTGEVPPPPPPPHGNFQAQPIFTNDNRHVWQYVERPPVHTELQQQGPPAIQPAPRGADSPSASGVLPSSQHSHSVMGGQSSAQPPHGVLFSHPSAAQQQEQPLASNNSNSNNNSNNNSIPLSGFYNIVRGPIVNDTAGSAPQAYDYNGVEYQYQTYHQGHRYQYGAEQHNCNWPVPP